MAFLRQCAQVISKDGQPVSWLTPLGLPVVQPYRRTASYRVRTVVQNVIIADHNEQLPVSVSKQKSAFPPNYVHSLDSTHMLLTALGMQKKDLTFASVHDSFWTHAGSVDEMNVILRDAFIRLHSQPLLEDLLESFKARYPHLEFPELPEVGDLDLELVRESDYFFD
eukprot:TRINITY_DN16020_c0_g1_i1.p1 TRINITY_DN16020_c0_g1~~TRINITY_DN16020_c0_g1_i1.p1  ORF type:complete len:167 (-),score=39.89 TRINITY_DN16020_c0_g1_i1:19-519(-)